MRRSILIFMLLLLFTLIFTNCDEDPKNLVVISPENGAKDQSLNVKVEAVFIPAMTTKPTLENFTLKKENKGDSLCTELTYDEASLSATCVHDKLEPNTSYTASVSGIEDSEDLSSTFRTISTETEIIKTSLLIINDKEKEIKFTFSEKIPNEVLYDFEVVGGGLAGDCQFSDLRKELVCFVSIIDDCEKFSGFLINLHIEGSVENYSLSYNCNGELNNK